MAGVNCAIQSSRSIEQEYIINQELKPAKKHVGEVVGDTEI